MSNGNTSYIFEPRYVDLVGFLYKFVTLILTKVGID